MSIAACPPAPDLDRPLSVALREATAEAHERAEGSAFVADLLGGRHVLEAYTALVAQNHAIYTALEAVTPRWADDPVAGPFVRRELLRVPSLEQDLSALLGSSWRSAAAELVQPATKVYVDHLRDVAGAWAPGFVAHHYVRYLGDLSGGQVVGRRVRDVFGTAGAAAVSFYAFDEIPAVKPFRDDYRSRLDALPLGSGERARMLDEAVVAFGLNRAVFVDLAAVRF
ncbi:biliverdin-producing heme oxygenase [Jatrophihabitans sp. YIM 134969]